MGVRISEILNCLGVGVFSLFTFGRIVLDDFFFQFICECIDEFLHFADLFIPSFDPLLSLRSQFGNILKFAVEFLS